MAGERNRTANHPQQLSEGHRLRRPLIAAGLGGNSSARTRDFGLQSHRAKGMPILQKTVPPHAKERPKENSQEDTAPTA
jgi:hypothetical protein